MEKITNYIKFSSRLDDKNYFTQIDLKRQHVRITENGVTVFDNKLSKFKKTVADGGWLNNHIYNSILETAEELINILSKA